MAPGKKNDQQIQYKDTTMALVLLSLIIWLFTKSNLVLYAAMVILIAGMTFPVTMKYPSKLWFGFSHILGHFMSKVLLSVIFFLLVTPLSLVMRIWGRDVLRLKSWRNEAQSLFSDRNHLFTKDDIEEPY